MVAWFNLRPASGRTAVRIPLPHYFSIPVKLRLIIRAQSHARSEIGWMDVRECTRAQLDEENNYAGVIHGNFHRRRRRSFSCEAFHGPPLPWKTAQRGRLPSMEDCPTLEMDGIQRKSIAIHYSSR